MSLSAIDRKARQCAVKRIGTGAYSVTSPSGRTYTVTVTDGGATANCTCAWGQHRANARTETGCAHMRAVWAYLSDPDNLWRVCDQASETYARLRDAGYSDAQAAAEADTLVGYQEG